MKKIGIKLADGSFYPILEEGTAAKKELNVTTVKDNQTTVKVGLYSSENSSMEDAEYIDTLRISNLKKRPNGAPTIGLSLGLDDEGRLSAELIDSETGQEAKTSVTLLSDMLGNDKNPGTGKGLLGAAEEINASDGIVLSEIEEMPATKEETIVEENRAAEEEIPLPDETQIEESANDAFPLTDEKSLQEESAISKEEIISEENSVAEKVSSEQDLTAHGDDFLGEENALPEEMALPEDEILPNETILEGTTDATEEEFSLPDEMQIEESENDGFPVLDEEPLPNIDESAAQDTDLPDLNLPDFDENIFPETAAIENSTPPKSEIQEAFGTADYKLDFSDTDFEMPDFSESMNGGASFADLPDLNLKDDASDNPFSDDEDFTDENEKTQKWPMIICLICALICIVAVLSLLFIIPSKFNVFFSRDEKAQAEPAQEVTQLPPPPASKVEEIQIHVAPTAKEDEVVVIPQAELVVPDLPYKEPSAHKTKEISYKIKWGDTLWDLSATYYKNPWLYPKIAKYNNIKNPNYIIAGTYINIPDI